MRDGKSPPWPPRRGARQCPPPRQENRSQCSGASGHRTGPNFDHARALQAMRTARGSRTAKRPTARQKWRRAPPGRRTWCYGCESGFGAFSTSSTENAIAHSLIRWVASETQGGPMRWRTRPSSRSLWREVCEQALQPSFERVASAPARLTIQNRREISFSKALGEAAGPHLAVCHIIIVALASLGPRSCQHAHVGALNRSRRFAAKEQLAQSPMSVSWSEPHAISRTRLRKSGRAPT